MKDVGMFASARHPDVTALSADFSRKHNATLTCILQHMDGERLRIPLRKLPVNTLPVRQFLNELLPFTSSLLLRDCTDLGKGALASSEEPTY